MHIRWIVGCLTVFAALGSKSWASEPACYLTAEAAAAQVGVRSVTGYRVEGRRRDVFSGVLWSTIMNCEHPERPRTLVLTSPEIEPARVTSPNAVSSLLAAAPGIALAAPRDSAPLILLAGTRVRFVQADQVSRIELNGLAQGSGALGDHVRVRILRAMDEGSERFVEGTIRSSTLVEVVTQ